MRCSLIGEVTTARTRPPPPSHTKRRCAVEVARRDDATNGRRELVGLRRPRFRVNNFRTFRHGDSAAVLAHANIERNADAPLHSIPARLSPSTHDSICVPRTIVFRRLR